ncbi:hypothetical protein cypCar_00035254 [Cyprinus carpio]|nr:hypothetical protein cypCar_00035254 [Cyprinus carpio]
MCDNGNKYYSNEPIFRLSLMGRKASSRTASGRGERRQACRAHGTFLDTSPGAPTKPSRFPIGLHHVVAIHSVTIREKLSESAGSGGGDSKTGDEEELKGLLGLPEEETELENLTEFNTAHNKRISTLTIEEGNLDIQRPKRKRKNSRVSFGEEDEIINPEDIDPSVGRFRNMVSTAVVPIKKKKMGGGNALGIEEIATRHMHTFPLHGGLYRDLPPASHEAPSGATILEIALPLPPCPTGAGVDLPKSRLRSCSTPRRYPAHTQALFTLPVNIQRELVMSDAMSKSNQAIHGKW